MHVCRSMYFSIEYIYIYVYLVCRKLHNIHRKKRHPKHLLEIIINLLYVYYVQKFFVSSHILLVSRLDCCFFKFFFLVWLWQ